MGFGYSIERKVNIDLKHQSIQLCKHTITPFVMKTVQRIINSNISYPRRKFEVEQYIELFEALRAEGHVLLDLGNLLSTSHPDQA